MWSENRWVTLVIITAITSQSSAQFQSKNTSEYLDYEKIPNKLPHTTEHITKFLRNVSNSSQILFEAMFANSMKNFIPFSDTNENCNRDGLQYEEGLNNQSRWAIQMYESSAKYPASDVQLGNFDRCMSVSSELLGIRGAYAVARIQFHSITPELTDPKAMVEEKEIKPMPIESVDILWALCFPDSCSYEDVEVSINRALIPDLVLAYHVTVDIAVPPLTYTSEQTAMPVTDSVLYASGIFAFGLALILAATVYDWFERSGDETIFSNTVRAFSVTRNLKGLVEDPKDYEFAVANGLKTLGLVSVIAGHRIAMDLGIPTFDREYPNHIFNDFWLSFMKSPVSVEIFFILSGFFTYIVIEKRLRNGKPLRFIHLLSYRIVRILPTYVTIIAIFALFLPYMGDGPLWKLIIYPEAEFCRKNWWTNLLFINNYVNPYEMCMVSTWYLACDMHFFIVGIILTYTTWRWKKLGTGIFGILFAASIYIPAKYIYDNEQWGVMPYSYSTMKNLRTTEHFQKVYIKSHHRITTYLIGMAAAYIYLKIKNSELKISSKSRALGLTICLLLHSACYIVTGYFYLPDQTYNPWHHLFYFTFQRIVYSLTISYILVVGSLSNFGYISSFIECKLFVAVARMSYVVYLVHLIVQLQSIGQIRQPFYGNFWSLYWRINSDFTTAFFYSLPINLIVEAPSRKIFQNLMGTIIKNEDETLDSDVQQNSDGHTKITVLPRFHKSP